MADGPTWRPKPTGRHSCPAPHWNLDPNSNTRQCQNKKYHNPLDKLTLQGWNPKPNNYHTVNVLLQQTQNPTTIHNLRCLQTKSHSLNYGISKCVNSCLTMWHNTAIRQGRGNHPPQMFGWWKMSKKFLLVGKFSSKDANLVLKPQFWM